MNFNYVCELKTANGMAGTMAFGDLLENCMRQRLIEQYNAPEYERVQLLHELSGLYSEAYENTTLFFGEEPVEVRFFGVPGGDEDGKALLRGKVFHRLVLPEKGEGKDHVINGVDEEDTLNSPRQIGTKIQKRLHR